MIKRNLICIHHSPNIIREASLWQTAANELNLHIEIFYQTTHSNYDFSQTPFKVKNLNSFLLKGIFFNKIRLFKKILFSSFRNKDEKTIVFIGGWSNSIMILAAISCSLINLPFLFWTDVISTESRDDNYKNKFRKYLLNFLFKKSFKLLTSGEPGIKAFQNSNLFNKFNYKFVNFPFYIDLKYFERNDMPIELSNDDKEKKIKFICAGWLVDKRKGQSIILKALAKQKSRNFELLVAGDGPDKIFLENLANELKISQNIIFLGQVSTKKLISHYLNCDVLIHASPVHEPYGLVVLEGMASGLLVLASDKTCSAIDRIVDYKNGIIHNSGDVNMLANQIKLLMNDRKLLINIRNASFVTSREWPLIKGANTIFNLFSEI